MLRVARFTFRRIDVLFSEFTVVVSGVLVYVTLMCFMKSSYMQP